MPLPHLGPYARSSPRFKALKKAEDMVLAAGWYWHDTALLAVRSRLTFWCLFCVCGGTASTMQVIALRPAGVFGPREPIVLPALAKSLQVPDSLSLTLSLSLSLPLALPPLSPTVSPTG